MPKSYAIAHFRKGVDDGKKKSKTKNKEGKAQLLIVHLQRGILVTRKERQMGKRVD